MVNQSEVRFYTFYNNREDANIVISLTPLNDGDADLLVSYGADERPVTYSAADWSSMLMVCFFILSNCLFFYGLSLFFLIFI
jgi:hypothetical protein